MSFSGSLWNISGEVVVLLYPKGFQNTATHLEVRCNICNIARTCSLRVWSESGLLSVRHLNASIVFAIFSGHVCFRLIVEELLTLDLVSVHPNILRIPGVLLLPIISIGNRCCLRITETPDIFGYRYQCWRDAYYGSLCHAKYVKVGELK